MDLQPATMTPSQRRVLEAQIETASESGQAALLTAAVLAVLMWIGVQLFHLRGPWPVVLIAPLVLSGLTGAVACQWRRLRLRRDLSGDVVVAALGQAELIHLDLSTAQEPDKESYLLRLGNRTVRSYSPTSTLLNLLLRPDPGTFVGRAEFAPHSGQLLGLVDAGGRQIYDAAETQLRSN